MKKHKYGAKKTVVDGITFDSKAEANRYCELKLLKNAGEVKDFTLQPKFELQPKFKGKDGKTVRAIHYIADFYITWKDGSVTVEDVKGCETKEFSIKKKMFEYKYPELKLVIVR
jgi:hypothetical protein